MLRFGIEWEFFVQNKDCHIIPAHTVTSNYDGNAAIGELRTGIHSNIIDCIYELKALRYKEEVKLKKVEASISDKSLVNVDSKFIKDLRQSGKCESKYADLQEFSIYPNGKLGKILPSKTFKSSLQINFSFQNSFGYTQHVANQKNGEYKKRSYSELFEYTSLIQSLDKMFQLEIQRANRVKGVCAIKDGVEGKRLEYRSLPSNVHFEDIIKALTV